MITWNKYKNNPEECYWSDFKKENELPGLVSQFKADGDGYHPKAEGPFVHNGYSYTAKSKTSKLGKPYWVIQRKPYSDLGEPSEGEIAHEAVKREYAQKDANNNRQASIEKSHQENLTEYKRQSQALENINETLTQILAELRLRSKTVE